MKISISLEKYLRYGNHVNGHWGDCNPSTCPMSASPATTTAAPTSSCSTPCQFPFIYQARIRTQKHKTLCLRCHLVPRAWSTLPAPTLVASPPPGAAPRLTSSANTSSGTSPTAAPAAPSRSPRDSHQTLYIRSRYYTCTCIYILAIYHLLTH